MADSFQLTCSSTRRDSDVAALLAALKDCTNATETLGNETDVVAGGMVVDVNVANITFNATDYMLAAINSSFVFGSFVPPGAPPPPLSPPAVRRRAEESTWEIPGWRRQLSDGPSALDGVTSTRSLARPGGRFTTLILRTRSYPLVG